MAEVPHIVTVVEVAKVKCLCCKDLLVASLSRIARENTMQCPGCGSHVILVPEGEPFYAPVRRRPKRFDYGDRPSIRLEEIDD